VLAFGQGAGGFDGAAFPAYLQGASAVVTSAGSNVLAECVLLEKPVLALHRRDDHEQALNALLLERSGAGMRATFEEVTTATLETFWRRVRSGDFRKIPLEQRLPDLISAFRDHALAGL
jgi:UDP:flavonoid glycosyltransferase YjiC (YdhE family)